MALTKAFTAGKKAAQKPRTEQTQPALKEQNLLTLPVSKIHPDPEQPRKEWDSEEQQSLQAAIKATNGATTPIKVRIHPEIDGEFMLVYGEGRWLSHTALGEGFELIPALLQDPSTDDFSRFLEQVLENVARFKMKAIHEAESFKNLMDLHSAKTGKKMKQKELCELIGKSGTYVSRALSLLKAPDEVKQLSLDNVTQSTNALAYLSQIAKLVDADELNEYIDEFRQGAIDELYLSKLIADLKSGDTNQELDFNDGDQHTSEDEAAATFDTVRDDEERDDDEYSSDEETNTTDDSDYGFYDYTDPYDKAIFDALMVHDAAFSILEPVKNEMAQNLVEVTKELSSETSVTQLLKLITEKLPQQGDDKHVIATLHNRRKLRIFFADELQKIADLQKNRESMLVMNSFEMVGEDAVITINGLDNPMLLSREDITALYEAL
jgi:ParB family chromosome partitioning protein